MTTPSFDKAVLPNLRRNRILNPALMVNQEFGSAGASGSIVDVINALQKYPADGVAIFQSGTGTVRSQQQTVAGSRTPKGSPSRLFLNPFAANAAPTAAQQTVVFLAMEGLNVADLAFGTTGAKSVTIQIGLNSSVAGNIPMALQNGDATRSYPFTVNIAAGEVNTDVYRTITIPGDTTGTWLKDTGIGMQVVLCLGYGTNFVGTASAWQAGNFKAISGAVQFMASTANTLTVFDLGLWEGTAVPAWEVPAYDEELRRCYRYFRTINGPLTGGYYTAISQTLYFDFALSPPMRAVPSGSWTGAQMVGVSSASFNAGYADKIRLSVVTAGAGYDYAYDGLVIANARL